MFTGLVQCVGKLERVVPGSSGSRFSIYSPEPLLGVELGASIAVDGVCLTVVAKSDHVWQADVSHETLRVTTLGSRKLGDPLHLERALRAGDPLGGHMVQGHVDFVGERTELKINGEAWDLAFRIPEDHTRYLVPKGSIAIDGVSLTVNWVKETSFGVTIIPHTANETHLTGDRRFVNMETDIVGKYIVGQLERIAGSPGRELSLGFLAEHGYLGEKGTK